MSNTLLFMVSQSSSYLISKKLEIGTKKESKMRKFIAEWNITRESSILFNENYPISMVHCVELKLKTTFAVYRLLLEIQFPFTKIIIIHDFLYILPFFMYYYVYDLYFKWQIDELWDRFHAIKIIKSIFAWLLCFLLLL